MHTAPLVLGAYHQVRMGLIDERLDVHAVTLCETNHLQQSQAAPERVSSVPPPILLSPKLMSSVPDMTRADTVPYADTVARAELASSSVSPSPSRPGPMESLISRAGLGSRASNKNAYDMSTMLRSIEKWDPVGETADEEPLSPMSGRTMDTPRVSHSVLNLSSPVLHLRNEAHASTPTLASLPRSIASGSKNAPGSSTLRSHTPSSTPLVSAFAQSLFGHHSAVSVPDVQQGSALWNTICVRLLPLFNGEHMSVPSEALAESMDTYVAFVFDQEPQRASVILEDNFRRLVGMGLLSVAARLQGHEGIRLLQALVAVWIHYYEVVIPYVQLSVWPLEVRMPKLVALQQAVKRAPCRASTTLAERQRADASAPTWASESLSDNEDDDSDVTRFTSMPPDADPPAEIDIRGILLQYFRDRIVLPIYDWMYMACVRLEPMAESEIYTEALHPRLLQLVGVLQSTTASEFVQERLERLRSVLESSNSHLPIMQVALDTSLGHSPSLNLSLSPSNTMFMPSSYSSSPGSRHTGPYCTY